MGVNKDSNALVGGSSKKKKVVCAVAAVCVVAAVGLGICGWNIYQNNKAIDDAAQQAYAAEVSQYDAIVSAVNDSSDHAAMVKAITDLQNLDTQIQNDADQLKLHDGKIVNDNAVDNDIEASIADLKSKIAAGYDSIIAQNTVDSDNMSADGTSKDSLNSAAANLNALKETMAADIAAGIIDADIYNAKVAAVDAAVEKYNAKAAEIQQTIEAAAAAAKTSTAGYSSGSSYSDSYSDDSYSSSYSDDSDSSSGPQFDSNHGAGIGECGPNYKPSYEELVRDGGNVGGDTSYEKMKEYCPWI